MSLIPSKQSLISRGAGYAFASLWVGLVITLIAEFLSPILASLYKLFGDKYWGYNSPLDHFWFGMVAAITASFFTFVLSKEVSLESDSNKLGSVINFLKFIGIFALLWLALALFGPTYDFICNILCV